MIKKAFVLAAGLGTRLRPLTDQLPKPLIPVGRKPLITFAFDHLIAEAGVEELIVNTHHRAEAFQTAFPDARYRGRPLRFRHEPVLLDSAGGIRNIVDLLGPRPETLLIYNGDILMDMPLGPWLRLTAPRATRSRWPCGPGTVRNMSPGIPPAAACSTSATALAPGSRTLIPSLLCIWSNRCFSNAFRRGNNVSVIPIFLDMIRQSAKIGGVLNDHGDWYDLGTRAEYLRVHRDLHAQRPPGPVFPRYGAPDPGWRDWIDPAAIIAPDARVLGASAVGAGARVGAGASIEDTILWPGAEITSGAVLKNCIVRTARVASGQVADRDF